MKKISEMMCDKKKCIGNRDGLQKMICCVAQACQTHECIRVTLVKFWPENLRQTTIRLANKVITFFFVFTQILT